MKAQKKFRLVLLTLSFCILFFSFSVKTQAGSISGNSLNYKKKTIFIGETFRLRVKNGRDFRFSTSNKKVATVNKTTGTVKGKAKGKATITARKGKIKLTCRVTVQKPVDILLFAGQSNMMGYGNCYEAPEVKKGTAYVYNPITNKNTLLPIEESKGKPFGQGQNDKYLNNAEFGISPRGSLIPAFVNAYFAKTKVPVIAVPATHAGSGSTSWAESRYKGAISRLNNSIKVAKKKGYTIRHVYMVWLQGESDAFAYMPAGMHNNNLKSLYSKMKKKTSIEKVLLINIPPYYGDAENAFDIKNNYDIIQNANRSLCKSNKNFVLISDLAPSFPEEWMYNDGLHLTQYALNLLGTDAGSKAGTYVNKQK